MAEIEPTFFCTLFIKPHLNLKIQRAKEQTDMTVCININRLIDIQTNGFDRVNLCETKSDTLVRGVCLIVPIFSLSYIHVNVNQFGTKL